MQKYESNTRMLSHVYIENLRPEKGRGVQPGINIHLPTSARDLDLVQVLKTVTCLCLWLVQNPNIPHTKKTDILLL